jgi:D-glycero-D-manno-heptose 1,7-bisphosphate phosphatase
LDRDGTIIVDRGYLADPDGVTLLPGAIDAMKALRAQGYALVVVSNQSGIARGLIREEEHAKVAARVVEVCAREGAPIDAAYYCPHGPDDGCSCRKPAPGMLLDAAREHGIDLTASLIVGDKASDLEAGRAAGCKTAYLGSEDFTADYRGADWNELRKKLSC